MSDLLPWMAPWSGRLLTAAVFLLGVALTAWAVRGRRLPYPHCPKCWYNLTGVAASTCPECGHKPKHEKRLHRRRRRTLLAVLGLLIAMSLPAFVAQRRIRMYGWGYYLNLYPLYAVFPYRKTHEFDVGQGLVVSFWRERREHTGYVAVHCHGRLAWEREGGWHWAIGSANEVEAGHRLIDLDGNGALELILVNNAGGVASNDEVTILSFDCSGKRPRLDSQCEFEGGGDFQDADGDGWLAELNYRTHFYRYKWTCGAGSPYPRLWMRYGEDESGTGLRIAADLFNQPLPEQVKIDASIAAAKADKVEAYGEALHLAMDMIYTGHAAEARKLLEAIDSYYPRKPDDAPLSEQVFAAVTKAPFGGRIMAMNTATPSTDAATAVSP